MAKIHYLTLEQYRTHPNGSYIKATERYFEANDVDLDKFKQSDFPEAWQQALDKEGKKKNLLAKENSPKTHMYDIKK